MAFRLFFASARNLSIKNSFAHRIPTNLSNNNPIQSQLLKCETPIIANIRPISFLQKRTGQDLWISCTSVSNAGMKRGRGRLAGKGKTKNLNAGQTIGEGRQRLILPGLNTMITRDKIIKQSVDKPDPEWNQKLYQLRDSNRVRNSIRVKFTHMERGYSGIKLAGRSVGSLDGSDLDGFDTRIIETKMLQIMRWRGRTRSRSAFVVTGNGNGIAGFGSGHATDAKASIQLARKHATEKLMHFQLDGRTIYHDFFTQFGPTKIYVYKMPEGYGLRVHRVLGTLCKLIGIKDLRAKVEGSTNPKHIVKAFIIGLLQQKTYDQMAEEKKMFLVEFSNNNLYYPKIVGRPADLSTLRTADQISDNEIMDFKQYCFNGKIPLKRPPTENYWEKMPTYERHLKKMEKLRSREVTRLHLVAKYGKLTSFLKERYDQKKLIEQQQQNQQQNN